jgi:hypothetical protein
MGEQNAEMNNIAYMAKLCLSFFLTCFIFAASTIVYQIEKLPLAYATAIFVCWMLCAWLGNWIGGAWYSNLIATGIFSPSTSLSGFRRSAHKRRKRPRSLKSSRTTSEGFWRRTLLWEGALNRNKTGGFRSLIWGRIFSFSGVSQNHAQANQKIQTSENHPRQGIIKRIIHPGIGEGEDGDLSQNDR